MRDHLGDWVADAARSGFGFSLSFEPGQFSLLCDNAVRPVPVPGVSLADTLVDSLNALVDSFPESARSSLFSTIRSSEFVPNGEIQSILLIGRDGRFHADSRRVEVRTEAARASLSLRQKLVRGLVAGGVTIAFFAISAAFVDYGVLFDQVGQRFSVMKLEDIEIDDHRYAEFLEIEPVELDRARGGIRAMVRRGPGWDWAVDATIPEEGPDGSPLRWETFYVLGNLVRGFVPCRFYDEEGKRVAEGRFLIEELRVAPEAEVLILLPRDARVVRVELAQ